MVEYIHTSKVCEQKHWTRQDDHIWASLQMLEPPPPKKKTTNKQCCLQLNNNFNTKATSPCARLCLHLHLHWDLVCPHLSICIYVCMPGKLYVSICILRRTGLLHECDFSVAQTQMHAHKWRHLPIISRREIFRCRCRHRCRCRCGCTRGDVAQVIWDPRCACLSAWHCLHHCQSAVPLSYIYLSPAEVTGLKFDCHCFPYLSLTIDAQRLHIWCALEWD